MHMHIDMGRGMHMYMYMYMNMYTDKNLYVYTIAYLDTDAKMQDLPKPTCDLLK